MTIKLNKNLKIFIGLVLMVLFLVIFSFFQTPKIEETIINTDEKEKIFAFFSNSETGDSNDCGQVFAVERYIFPDYLEQKSLMVLLEGPTISEKDKGYFTSINAETEVNNFHIDEGIAYVDFNGKIESGGSCKVSAIRSQIEKTLMQFSNIKKVIISVNGNVGEALQP